MNDGKYDRVLVSIAAACIGAFVAVWWLDYAVVRANWCEGAAVSCFRDWMSASSGWVAAIVAIGVATVTFIPLRQQVAEAKRQTDFTVGDEPPSIDAVHHFEEMEDVVVTITNWNRRNVLIHEIELLGTPGRTQLWNAEIDDVRERIGQSAKFQPPIVLKGWLKRSDPPHNFKVRAIALDANDQVVLDWEGNHEVEVTFQIIGNASPVSAVRTPILRAIN